MAEVPKDSAAFVAREEFLHWSALAQSLRHKVPLKFGDYGIVYPYFDGPQISVNANAKIRYTAAQSWMVVRGHSLYRPPDSLQYRSLADQVISDKCFSGANFSWGDQQILDCARGQRGPGSLGDWVAIGTNHHLELVARQVQSVVREKALISG